MTQKLEIPDLPPYYLNGSGNKIFSICKKYVAIDPYIPICYLHYSASPGFKSQALR